MDSFSHFCALFPKQVHKMHKITSIEVGMTNFLRPKFWSHGTYLGSLRPPSQKGLPIIFSNVIFLHPWDTNKAPVNASSPSHTKTLDHLPTWCAILMGIKICCKLSLCMLSIKSNFKCHLLQATM